MFARLLSKSFHAFVAAYILPWQNRERATILFSLLLGSYTIGAQIFILAYAMAEKGFEASCVFQISRQLLMGFIGIPVSFWLMSGKWGRLGVCVVQGLGSALYAVDPASPFLNALAAFLIMAPFWSGYGIRFARARSEKNHGNETALQNFLSVLAGALGYLSGGFVLEAAQTTGALVLCGLGVVVATQMIYQKTRRIRVYASSWRMLGLKKPMTRLSLFIGFVGILIYDGLPIWMQTTGIPPLSAGTTLAMRQILGFILTPIAGWLILKGGLRAGLFGGAFLFLGWLLMAISSDFSWLLLPALALLTVGINLVSPAEISRWWKRKSETAIIAREMALTMGRIPSYILGLPVIFFAAPFYPLLGLVASGFLIAGSKKRT